MKMKECGVVKNAFKVKSHIFLIILTIVVLIGVAANVMAKEPLQFKIGYASSSALSGGKLIEYIAKEINEASAGEIDAKPYFNALLGTDPEMTDKVRMGVIQAVATPVSQVGNTVPFADMLALPYVTDTWEKCHIFRNSPVAKEYLKAYDAYGYKALGLGAMGLYGLQVTKKNVRTLNDVSKIKFRVAEVPIYLKTFESFGVKPTVITFAELYEALKQGVIEGCDLPPEVAGKVKFTEVIKTYILTGHSFGWFVVLVNKKWYDKLPDELKMKIDNAVDKACQEQWKFAENAEKVGIQELKSKYKVDVVNLSKEEIDQYKQATKKVVDWRLSTYDQKSKDLAAKVFKVVGY